MKINFIQMQALTNALTEIKDMKMPFKLGLIIAKNMSLLEKEIEFYVEQERKFVNDYLERDPETGELIQEQPGRFKIKEGLQNECWAAREELNEFETEVEFRKIPVALMENMEFTPKAIAALEMLFEEE